MITCGCCQGPYSLRGADRFACSNHVGKGICDKSRTIPRVDLEARVLAGLRDRMMAPEIVEAITDGMYHPSMKQKMTGLEARKAELTTLLSDAPADTPDLLPSAAPIYANKVAALADALNQPDARPEATEALRMLIDKIVLTPGPERGEVFATLHGELGTILDWTDRQALGKTIKTTKPAAGATGLLVSMVAGAGFEPTTFRL